MYYPKAETISKKKHQLTSLLIGIITLNISEIIDYN